MRTIVCVLYPDVMSLDVIGTLQVFASANTELNRVNCPPAYQIKFAAHKRGTVVTSAGFNLEADISLDEINPSEVNTIIIPGGSGIEDAIKDKPFIDWIRNIEPKVQRIGSVCSGALALAEAGILNGRRATTHWDRMSELEKNYPNVIVDLDCIHTYNPNSTDESHIFTSAGVTSGIDLAIALIEHDLGQLISMAVARRLLVYIQRPGKHTQFSPFINSNTKYSQKIKDILKWISLNINKNPTIEDISNEFEISSRTLRRQFIKELGKNPRQYLQECKLKLATTLLNTGHMSVENVAMLSGYEHTENMRRSFHQQMHISPSEYKHRP